MLIDDVQDRPKALAAIQAKLLVIFEDILAQNSISTTTSFVDLGGDSLSAMLCISRVRHNFEIELSMEDFFSDDSSVKGLSVIIDSILSSRQQAQT